MQKDNVSRISVQMLDGANYGTPIIVGKPEEILSMAMTSALISVQEKPCLRKAFLALARNILRETRPEWLNTAAVYTLGVGVIFGTVFLVGNGIVLIGKVVGLW